jgi:hypothetical protein
MVGSAGQVWQRSSLASDIGYKCLWSVSSQFRPEVSGGLRPDWATVRAVSPVTGGSSRAIRNDTFRADWVLLLWVAAMKQPLKMARRLGLAAVGVAVGFIVVPLIIFVIAVLHEISECVCPAPPLADGIWFALVFSIVGLIGSLMAVSQPRDSAVFMSAGGLGLLGTGAVMVVGGMASPDGEAFAWGLAGVALGLAAVTAFRSRGSKQGKRS